VWWLIDSNCLIRSVKRLIDFCMLFWILCSKFCDVDFRFLNEFWMSKKLLDVENRKRRREIENDVVSSLHLYFLFSAPNFFSSCILFVDISVVLNCSCNTDVETSKFLIVCVISVTRCRSQFKTVDIRFSNFNFYLKFTIYSRLYIFFCQVA
jgi:hypothetical protein